MDDARILEIARLFEAYPGSREPALRGAGIVEFARAVLAERDVCIPTQPAMAAEAKS